MKALLARGFRSGWLWLILIGFLLLGARSPTVITSGVVNRSMLAYLKQLGAPDMAEDDAYPHYRLLSSDRFGLDAAPGNLRRALVFDSDHATAKWALARIELALGRPQEAARALDGLETAAGSNVLLYYDMLAAASMSGEFAKAVALYEGHPNLPIASEVVSDTLAVAYTRLAETSGDSAYLEKASRLRPWNLAGLYRVWVSANARGETDVANEYRQRLSRFALPAVHQADERWLNDASMVIPAVREAGIWSREQTAAVASFLVWQYYRSSGVQSLLQTLAAAHPQEPEWSFNLAEVHHRRGELALAAEEYRMALEKGFAAAEIYRRLGEISRQQGETQQADLWFEQVLGLVPNDVFALAKLSEMSGGGKQNARDLDSWTVVAKRLGVPVDAVQLGPDLSPEGRFEEFESGFAQNWAVADYVTGSDVQSPEAAFFAAPDSLMTVLSDSSAMHLMGLWQAQPGKGLFGIVARRDLVRGTYLFDIKPGTVYLVSGLYRTAGQSEQAAVYLGHPSATLLSENLPATDMAWQQFDLVGCREGAAPQGMQLLLSVQSAGQVWFDDVSVREVVAPRSAPACNSLLNPS